jgi:hypothetical protein
MGLLFARQFAKAVLIPNALLVPIIVVLSFIASLALRGTVEDIIVAFVFGFLGYLMSNLSLSRSLRRFGPGSRRSGRGQFSSLCVDRPRVLSDLFYASTVAQFVCSNLGDAALAVFEVQLRRGTTRCRQHSGLAATSGRLPRATLPLKL